MTTHSGRPANEPAEFKGTQRTGLTATGAAILAAHDLQMPDAVRRHFASRRDEFRHQLALGGRGKDPAARASVPGVAG